MLALAAGCAVPPATPPAPPPPRDEARHPPAGDPNCEVQSLTKSVVQGLRVVSPDGRRYLVNKEDEKGTAQVY